MGYSYKGERHRPHKRKRRARANWEHKYGLIVWMDKIMPYLAQMLEFDRMRKKAELQKIEQGFSSGGVYNNLTEGEYIVPKNKTVLSESLNELGVNAERVATAITNLNTAINKLSHASKLD